MTKREFFEAVIALNDEVTKDFAKKELEKMDARNASRSSKPTAKQVENEGLKEQIPNLIGDGKTAKGVGEAMNISTQKASALLRQMVENGLLVATEEKVDKRKVKVYRLAESE